jgi:hypothetical protein
MIQDAAEPFAPDISLPDTRVPIDIRSERRFRVVGVEEADILEPEDLGSGANGGA